MSCAAEAPVDGPAWAELAKCLEDRRLPEAAARAWRRAWEADPALAGRALDGALAFAHRTGDDDLVVAIAASLVEVPDPDAAAHLAYAQAGAGERLPLEAIPVESCRYPFARYRLAQIHAADGKLRSEVMALREAMQWDPPEGLELGRGPLWETWSLRDAALLQVASVYADLGRPQNAGQYAEYVVRPRDPVAAYGHYTLAWSALRRRDPEGAVAEAELALDAIPEASAVLVAARPDEPGLAEAAHARWEPIRHALVAFVERHSDHPETAPDAIWDLDLPREALAAVGSMGPLLTAWVRSYALDPELRRTRRGSVARDLAEEAERELAQELGVAMLAAATHGVDRIDAALAAVDAPDPRLPHHSWTPRDFGW